jgi:Ran GTPase-activating protein (RanGAP) involved in mRNA processing and transport
VPPGNYISLRDFSAYSNALSGQVPSFLIVESLHSLALQNNKFVGELPLIWFEIPSLLRIDLSDNALSGSLPATLGSLSNLNTLAASNCGLMGQLPNELADTALQKLLLDGNRFLGTVPEVYERLPLCEFIVSCSVHALTNYNLMVL